MINKNKYKYMAIAKYNISNELIYFTNPNYIKDEILFTPVAKNADSSKKRKNRFTSTNNFNEPVNSEDLIEFQITENIFTVELLEPKEFSKKIRYSNVWWVRVKVSNPELDPGHTYLLTISLENFLDMTFQTDIINKKFKDQFSIHIAGGYFTLVSVNDEDYKISAEVGKLLANNRKTTKWIEGHRYLLPNRNEFIYLGKFYGFYHYSLVPDKFSYGISRQSQRYLCMNLTGNHPLTFPEKNEKLSEYFNRLVKGFLDKTLDINNLLGFTKCTSAVDLGEVVMKDLVDLDNVRRYLVTLSLSFDPNDDILPRFLGMSEDKDSCILPEFRDLMLSYLDQQILKQVLFYIKYPSRIRDSIEYSIMATSEVNKYASMFNMSDEEIIERVKKLIDSTKH